MYEKLFIKLRLFKHGEGMLMNLNRIALFFLNPSALHQPAVRTRFVSAIEEPRKIIYPEINSIAHLLKALQNEPSTHLPSGFSLLGGDYIPNLANQLQSSMERFAQPEAPREVRCLVEEVRNIISETSRQGACSIHSRGSKPGFEYTLGNNSIDTGDKRSVQ